MQEGIPFRSDESFELSSASLSELQSAGILTVWWRFFILLLSKVDQFPKKREDLPSITEVPPVIFHQPTIRKGRERKKIWWSTFFVKIHFRLVLLSGSRFTMTLNHQTKIQGDTILKVAWQTESKIGSFPDQKIMIIRVCPSYIRSHGLYQSISIKAKILPFTQERLNPVCGNVLPSLKVPLRWKRNSTGSQKNNVI